jgi:predicted nucleic acid-binding protein
MSVFYFDTSAIVKRYIVETGTAWIMALIWNVKSVMILPIFHPIGVKNCCL